MKADRFQTPEQIQGYADKLYLTIYLFDDKFYFILSWQFSVKNFHVYLNLFPKY